MADRDPKGIAKRSDWRAEPMPDECERISVSKVWSFEEFARMARGVVPMHMEEKWFVYYEAPWLFLHRSWTGICIFRVRFEQTGNGMGVAEAFVNRAPDQYGHGEDDAALLSSLLDDRADERTHAIEDLMHYRRGA